MSITRAQQLSWKFLPIIVVAKILYIINKKEEKLTTVVINNLHSL